MDALWNNVTADSGLLDRIVDSLGLTSAEQLPNLADVTDAQIQIIREKVGEAIGGKVMELRQKGSLANPALQPANVDYGDGSGLTLLMMELQAKLGEIQIGTAKEGVKISKDDLAAKSKERLEKLKDVIEKMGRAKRTGLLGKICGWAGAIAGLVAAVALTVSTGGTMAWAGLFIASAAVGMMIAQETGDWEKVLQAVCGDDEKARMWFQIGIMAVMMIGGFATAGAQASSLTAKGIMIFAGGVEGVAAVGGGIAAVDTAIGQKQLVDAQAKSKELQAWIAKFQAALQDNQDALEKAIEQFNKGNAMIIDILKSISDSHNTIAMQMGA